MTLTQLQAFLAAARHLSFTTAADELGLSQPAVSDLVRRLEQELGTALFERHARGLVLAEPGRQLLTHAERAVSAAEQGAAAVKSLLSLAGGRATLGLLRNADFYLRRDLARRFHSLHPNVRVRLVGQNSAETADDVATGQLEAGLVALPVDGENLDVVPLARDEILYVSADPSHVEQPPTIEDLCRRPLVLYDAHFATSDPVRRQLEERAQLVGETIEPIIEVEYLGSALALAREGFGDTLACRASTLSEAAPPGLHSVSLADPLYETLALIKRHGRPLSPGTRELARLAFESLTDQATTSGITLLDSPRIGPFLDLAG